jgi:hypothetical protein
MWVAEAAGEDEHPYMGLGEASLCVHRALLALEAEQSAFAGVDFAPGAGRKRVHAPLGA